MTPKNKKNTSDFVFEAKKVHGDKYDYSVTRYYGAREKLKIKCKKHGVFEQTAGCHLSGKGCRKCGFENMAKSQKSSISHFVNRAKSVHGPTYDYSKVVYKTALKKVEIICKTHGPFFQSPNNHYAGDGCPECRKGKMRDKFLSSREEFIKKAKKIHGSKYDYSLVDYKGAFKHVKIKCKKHGAFNQSPTNHLSKNGCGGCPACVSSSGEKEIRRSLIALGWHFEQQKHIYDGESTSPLRMDFYIPKIKTCVEYHGAQHYYAVDFFGGEQSFNNTKQRDKRKRMYCKKNNIRLIEIPYLKKDKIAEILLNEIGAYECEEIKSVSFSGIGIQQRLF